MARRREAGGSGDSVRSRMGLGRVRDGMARGRGSGRGIEKQVVKGEGAGFETGAEAEREMEEWPGRAGGIKDGKG